MYQALVPTAFSFNKKREREREKRKERKGQPKGRLFWPKSAQTLHLVRLLHGGQRTKQRTKQRDRCSYADQTARPAINLHKPRVQTCGTRAPFGGLCLMAGRLESPGALMGAEAGLERGAEEIERDSEEGRRRQQKR